MKTDSKAIIERWISRVLANDWHLSAEGADAYLEKYGKNISNDKVQALADYARAEGCELFALGMECHLNEANKLYTVEDAEEIGFNDDMISEAQDPQDSYKSMNLMETTAKYLAEIKAGTACGSVPNQAWVPIGRKYPNLRVRVLLMEMKAKDSKGKEFNHFFTGSPDIKLDSKKVADDISSLANDDLNGGHGSLRGEYHKPGWTYFETE